MKAPSISHLLLILLCLAIYAQTLDHGFAYYDDDRYVSENPRIDHGLTLDNLHWAFTATVASNWHPVTLLSYLLDGALWGRDPRGYHFTDILLHTLNTCLLLHLLLQIRAPRPPPWLPFLAAALWAAHPLRVESVAWIAERKDLLSALFLLLTLRAWAAYARRPRPAPYLLALLLAALGLMAKPMLVTLPALLLLADLWPLRRTTWPRLLLRPLATPVPRLILEKIPFLFLSALAVLATLHAQTDAISTHIPLHLRLANALVSPLRYIELTLAPFGLLLCYPYPPSWPASLLLLSALALPLLTLATLLAALRHPRTLAFLPATWLWFLISLLPVIGIIQAGRQSIADRYTYIPHLGLLVLLLWGAHALARRRPLVRNFLLLLAAAYLLLLPILAWRQTARWATPQDLIEESELLNRPHPILYARLAARFAALQDWPRAVEWHRRALLLNPADPDLIGRLGSIILLQGHPARALPLLLSAHHARPDDHLLTLNLIHAHLDLHQPQPALDLSAELLNRALIASDPALASEAARLLLLSKSALPPP